MVSAESVWYVAAATRSRSTAGGSSGIALSWRSHPDYAAPRALADVLRVLLDPARLAVLAD